MRLKMHFLEEKTKKVFEETTKIIFMTEKKLKSYGF